MGKWKKQRDNNRVKWIHRTLSSPPCLLYTEEEALLTPHPDSLISILPGNRRLQSLSVRVGTSTSCSSLNQRGNSQDG
ncbi:hypothetical protein PBY51_018219 [Eleginops maclovinus]|uniref:Uncharacterized protein n=1 Tax=Eleginops maclovinus TaxID=56733 RepID=A0AAN7XM06_ELEMC|nr:hypothetical protein PBY51_018219 [Eleginops maclovinus]